MSSVSSAGVPQSKPTRAALDPRQIAFTSDEQRQVVAGLIDEFTLRPSTLAAIKDHFILELKKGLAKDGETVAMVPVFVSGRLDGSEAGSFLTLDIGGTFLRVVFVILAEGQVTMQQKKYTIDDELKVGEGRLLFVNEHGITAPTDSAMELGFTFSFPVLQTTINSGKLIAWTKGFSCPGVVGWDPAALLQDAFHRRNIPVRVASLLNDTVGTLLAYAYHHKNTAVGLGLGTGTNAAYIEKIERITKRKEDVNFGSSNKAQEMVINMEFGAFDSERRILPLTMFDTKVDQKSLNQGKQIFEKMIAGMYLGEIVRNVLAHLTDQGLLFRGQGTVELNTAWALDTKYMSTIEADQTPGLDDIRDILKTRLGFGSVPTSASSPIDPTSLTDRQIVKIVVELVGKRAARLCAAAVAGILEHTRGFTWQENDGVDIGVDGSLFRFYPSFEADMQEGLCEIFEARHDDGSVNAKSGTIDTSKIRMGLSLDGSGVGAALCALLAATAGAAGGGR
ncbi:glucokinase [Mortierella sp. NVP85]|nr:glucokinase [Mortierella sp. NVP85]